MENNKENISANNNSEEKMRNSKKSESNSWLMGLIAFILAIVSYWMDPYILVLFLDITAGVLSVIALVKNYRLKGFAIAALVIATICIVLGAVDVAMSVALGDNWEDKISYLDSASNSSSNTDQYSSTNNSTKSNLTSSTNGKVIVKVTDKENFKEDLSIGRLMPYCQFTVVVKNNTEQNIKGVQGILTIKDLFGKEIMKRNCDFTGTTVNAGNTVTFKRGIDINEFIDSEVKLYNEKYEDLQFEYKITDIVYE